MSGAPKVFDTKPCCLELEAGEHLWCSCGMSGHPPMCDFSHKGTGCFPKKFSLAGKQMVCLCNCKQTKTPPFCDGSHQALAG